VNLNLTSSMEQRAATENRERGGQRDNGQLWIGQSFYY